MSTDHGNVSLPEEAMSAADRGDLIDAIRITRETTGLGLEDAKDAVDAYARGAGTGDVGTATIEVPSDAVASLYQGKLIDAIKRTRAKTGLGLKDAKDAVELCLARNPTTKQRFEAAIAEQRKGVLRIVRILVVIGLVILGYLWFAENNVP